MNDLENKPVSDAYPRAGVWRHGTPALSLPTRLAADLRDVGAVITELAGYATTQSVGRGSARSAPSPKPPPAPRCTNTCWRST